MKTLSLILLMLTISIASAVAQKDTTNFFFNIETDSIRGCYGKCLIQSKWENIEKEEIVSYENTYIKPTLYYTQDTIKTDYFFLAIDNPNIKYIINYVDTVSQQIIISEEIRRLEVIPVEYETVTEQYLFRKEFKSWTYSNSGNICNSNNWELELKPAKYKTRTKRVIRSPSPLREVVIPAEYITVIKITPKEGISKHELDNVKLLCKKYYLNRVKKYTSEIKTKPPKKKVFKEMRLFTPSHVEYRKIDCDINSKTISKIQKQLYALGFYSGNFQGELTEQTKEAIIRYQMKYYLPIGQLDEETVENIIGKKTRFYP